MGTALDLQIRAYGDVAMAAINQLDTADIKEAKKRLPWPLSGSSACVTR